jgi:hypothetical protein
MATVPQKIAADLADKMFGFGSKIATGEMTQAELDVHGREEWPLHYAIADALHGIVKAFDQYQGPYVTFEGKDLRSGQEPYQVAPRMPGIVRLWISSEDGIEGVVYNEETDKQSTPFLLTGPSAEDDAVNAAKEVLGKQVLYPDAATSTPDAWHQESSDEGPRHLNSPLEGKSARLVKTADGSMLIHDDHPSSNTKLQQIMGDSLDQPITPFAQFWPNVGTMQMPNPLSPIEGDACFFTYMVPGAVFQSHDGQQWVIDDYNGGPYGVQIYNRWYPRLRAWVNVDDIRRSIHSWVEPVQVVVPPPPPGVNYIGQPVRIVDGKSHA